MKSLSVLLGPLSALMILGAGCASNPQAESWPGSLVGDYTNGDTARLRTLILNANGTYIYSQEYDRRLNTRPGTSSLDDAWIVTGYWSFVPPDRIEMATGDSPKKTVVYTRKTAEGEIVILEPDVSPGILQAWKYVASTHYLKRKAE